MRVQMRFAPLLAVAAMTAVAACDGERIPTEPGLQGGDVEVIDGITFTKTTGPIQASYVYEGPEGYVCEAIDFEEFAHGEIITSTTLFGQAVSVEITDWNDIGEATPGRSTRWSTTRMTRATTRTSKMPAGRRTSATCSCTRRTTAPGRAVASTRCPTMRM